MEKLILFLVVSFQKKKNLRDNNDNIYIHEILSCIHAVKLHVFMSSNKYNRLSTLLVYNLHTKVRIMIRIIAFIVIIHHILKPIH